MWAQLAALETARTVLPIPETALIGQPATLAGIREDLWRPLARLPADQQGAALRGYRSAIDALEQSLHQERAQTDAMGPR